MAMLAGMVVGDLPAKAREVATAARDALPPASTYEHYQVVLTKQEEVVIRTGTGAVHNFESRDLPTRPAASP